MTNILPVETFRKIMGFHPFHFWQLANATTPVDSNCSDLTFEYSWKSAAAGRDDIRQAIETAEKKLADYLGYYPAPHDVVSTVDFPRYFDHTMSRVSQGGSDGRWLSVTLPETKVISVGIAANDFIQTVNQAQITFIDSDGDGLPDVWLMSVNTTVTDPDQIAVYFGGNDRIDAQPIGDAWRITPLQIDIAAGVATIRGKPWQIVRPIKYSGVSLAALDPSVMTNFALSLDVYHKYTDPTGTTQDTAQAVMIWETRPWPDWSFCLNCGVSTTDNSSDPAAQAYALARVGLRDIEQGIVSVGDAIYNSATGLWTRQSYNNCRPPDRIEIRYRAGDDLEHWETVIARLAASELGKRVCACDTANRELYAWQIDRAYTGGANLEKFFMSAEDQNNPFGTRAGQIFAFHAVKRLYATTGIRA